jgi:regulator of sigma E protease
MTYALTTIVAFAFALGLLIVVHEFGHYLAALLCNVKVLRFSVGFGRVVASRRYGADSTEWALAAFPLGGYVKMLDEREGAVAEADLPRAFNRQSVFRRFVIVVAGPVANFLLAIFLYWLVFMHGVPGVKPVIGAVTPASAAAQAQFAPGDTILKIGPDTVATWQDARWVLLKYAVEHGRVAVEVENEHSEIHVRALDMSHLTPGDLDGDFLRALGFARPQPPLAPVIGRVIAGSAADRAGLQSGDEILAADDAPVKRWDDVVAAVSASPGRQLALRVRRANTTLDLQVIPEPVVDGAGRVGRIGVTARVDEAAMRQYLVEVRYSAWTSAGKALERTWDTSIFSLRMLGKMLAGEVSLKNLSGPLTIADYAGQSAQIGWITYLVFLALISISLGVLNLLPIPLLDGGHLMYYMLEIVKGSPVSDKAMEVGQRIGMGLLFMLMAFALYNDITRLFNA